MMDVIKVVGVGLVFMLGLCGCQPTQNDMVLVDVRVDDLEVCASLIKRIKK